MVELRTQAEQRLRLTDPNASAPTPEQMASVVHELQVHQIELEMQNEELRRTQAELEAASDRYENLFNLAPLGYFILKETGGIRQARIWETGAFMMSSAWIPGTCSTGIFGVPVRKPGPRAASWN